MLIKSFEGFRPRAVQDPAGAWVIGYGHTASAREGATIGEADAELLLQYDLMPVVKALNENVTTSLNQHQFDALASFAISVGVDTFLESDVLGRINAGRSGEAADALIGWPERPDPRDRLRRRSAERALFVADPASPVALADLLAAPFVPAPAVSPQDDGITDATPASEEGSAPEVASAEPFPFAMHDGVSPFPPLNELVLTPAVEADVSGESRTVWTPEQRDDAPDGQTLFEDEPSAAVLRHEVEPAEPRRFEWGETGMYLVMGALGLAACAFSAAAFRMSVVKPSPMGETTVVAWALALIGLLCVGVSSWNLYVRWGKRD